MIRHLVMLMTLLCLPAYAAAQQSASPYLPAQHWAHDALHELELRGAVTTRHIDPGSRSTTLLTALAAFEHASADTTAAEAVRRRAADYAALLRAEFGEAGDAPRRYAVRAGGEYRHHDGRVSAGDGYEEWDYTGARPRSDISAGGAVLALDARSGAFAFTAEGVAGNKSRLHELQAVVRFRDLQLWAGRRAFRYGPAEDGLVLNSDVSFNGAGLGLTQPVRVPSFFRGHGRLNIEGFVARMDSVGRVDNPYFLGARLAYMPHPRFTVGISRGAIFGGDNNSPVTVTNLLRMMIGLYSGNASDFENQIISFDMRYRIPSVPLLLYYEWGMDDGSGAWLLVPGITAGAVLTLDAGDSPVDVGFERTSFDPSCCGNPIWYRHNRFRGSWADDGVPIAHPLGGEGSEHAVFTRTAAAGGALRLDARGFVRRRGAENLFSPGRDGRSTGGEVGVAWRATRSFEVVANARTEHGADGWSETMIRTGARLRLISR